MTDPAQIAAKLTEAEVNLLLLWPKGLFDSGTAKALTKRGLIDGRTVTPLGEAVRQHLTNQQEEPHERR